MKNRKKKIELGTPWGETNLMSVCFSPRETEVFLTKRTRLHELYIKEQEKTKRISLILAVLLILIAVALLIFAPKGKETLSYIVCGILFIFAAGTVGYGRIKGKIPFAEFEADNIKK